MTLSARDENAKVLAKLLGLEDSEAAELLGMTILVRADADDSARAIGRDVVNLLERTVGVVRAEDGRPPSVEVLVGNLVGAGAWPIVRIGVTRSEVVVSCEAIPEHEDSAEVPEIILLVAACYAAGMAVRLGLRNGFPLPHANTIRLPVAQLIRGCPLNRPVDLHKLYVAGAGAISNGLLQGLARLDVRGEFHIVDPKQVTPGNLNRCLWFERADIGLPKADALVNRAQPAMRGAKLVARTCRVQDLLERSSGPWLERLVVAVDSRRARRGLQEELPREVFDASTTGIEEVVVHFNRATTKEACLSCIYAEDAVEAVHEKHVADMLGVSVDDVREHYIGADAACRIAARHTGLNGQQLVGTAYDTLFKTLCATGQLGVDEGRTILAPFSFVSVLAGAYLALELVLRSSSADVTRPFNYWRASPWTSPVFELQALRPARPQCETCGNAVIRATVGRLWGLGGKEAI